MKKLFLVIAVMLFAGICHAETKAYLPNYTYKDIFQGEGALVIISDAGLQDGDNSLYFRWRIHPHKEDQGATLDLGEATINISDIDISNKTIDDIRAYIFEAARNGAYTFGEVTSDYVMDKVLANQKGVNWDYIDTEATENINWDSVAENLND